MSFLKCSSPYSTFYLAHWLNHFHKDGTYTWSAEVITDSPEGKNALTKKKEKQAAKRNGILI